MQTATIESTAPAAADVKETSKGTLYELGTTKDDRHIARLVRSYIDRAEAAKQANARAEEVRGKLREWCEARWHELYSHHGKVPAAPFRVLTSRGEEINFVVSDRTGDARLGPDEQLSLGLEIGADGLHEATYMKLEPVWDDAILDSPIPFNSSFHAPGQECDTLRQFLSLALPGWLSLLASTNVIFPAQANAITFQRVTRIKRGLLASLPRLARAARGSLRRAIESLGSKLVRSVQA